MNNLKLICCTSIVSLLVACGGGSSDNGSTTTSTGQSLAADVSVAATETAKLTIAADSADLPVSAVIIETLQPLEALKTNIQHLIVASTDTANTLPVGPTVDLEPETEQGVCGGTLQSSGTSTSPDNQNDIYPISVTGTIIFDNYCLTASDYQIVYNGDVEYALIATENSISTSYDYDISYVATGPNGQQFSETIHFSESCVTTNGSAAVCSISSSYESTNGNNYTLSETSVSGDANSGYNVSGTLVDNDNNIYTIAITNLTQCENGNIATGEIIITVNGGELITVTFPNCDEYVVTYLGATNTYSQ